GGTLLTRCIRCVPCRGCTVEACCECRFDPVGRKGYGTQPHPSSVEDRIREGGGHRSCGGLASAERRQCRPIKEGYLDGRDVWEGQNRITYPIHTGDAGAIERYFLVQCAAKRLHDRAFDLVAQPI